MQGKLLKCTEMQGKLLKCTETMPRLCNGLTCMDEALFMLPTQVAAK